MQKVKHAIESNLGKNWDMPVGLARLKTLQLPNLREKKVGKKPQKELLEGKAIWKKGKDDVLTKITIMHRIGNQVHIRGDQGESVAHPKTLYPVIEPKKESMTSKLTSFSEETNA